MNLYLYFYSKKNKKTKENKWAIYYLLVQKTVSGLSSQILYKQFFCHTKADLLSVWQHLGLGSWIQGQMAKWLIYFRDLSLCELSSLS